MNKIAEKEMIDIESMIYEIKGVQVMIDSDLAKLYNVETKRINEAVKNNPEKFPERLNFILTDAENKNYGGRRYNTRVFTEQGVYMLATILKSKIATQVTLNIMDTFVIMKRYLNNTLIEQKYINNMVLKHDEELKMLNTLFNELNGKEKINTILFDGEFYDAYSIFMDILNKANDEVIIIDNYAGKELLDILKNINKKITIVSKNIDNVLRKKYESQYNNVDFIDKNIFHDRFLIIDKNLLYSFEASFKDLGKKCFAINEMKSVELLNILLSKIYTE